MRILLVDDDKQILSDIKEVLVRQTYLVDVSNSVQNALTKCIDNEYDCAIVDWTLPDGEGTSIVSELRKNNSKTKILMLTARTRSLDVVHGLNLGADDYLTKPFEMDILLARLRSLLRRKELVENPIITISDLTINTNTHQVTRSNQSIELSPKEYSLLEYLALHVNQALERLTLLEHIWGDSTDTFSNTVDVHVSYLRQKIDKGQKNKLIQTVKNVGYMLARP
jgi:DNA-binding response OmpR family regulator